MKSPNFLDNLCRQWRVSLTVGKCLSRLLVVKRRCNDDCLPASFQDYLCRQLNRLANAVKPKPRCKKQNLVCLPAMTKWYSCLPAPLYNSHDIPSRKRVMHGCTNNLYTGATLSGVGEGQRLRKGFQSGGVCETLSNQRQRGFPIRVNKLAFSGSKCLSTGRNPVHIESLSSAAEIRHSARNTRLRLKNLRLACIYN